MEEKMGGKRMIVKVSDNIISPLGTTSAENYAAVKAGMSALRRYDGLWGIPEPFFASLLDRNAFDNDRQTIDEKIVIDSISKALEGTDIDTTWTKVLFIISTTKGNVFLLDEREKGFPKERVRLGMMAREVTKHFRNPNEPIVVSNACISGVCAQIESMRYLESGEYDYVIVGHKYPDIHTESVRVVKKNEKYVVYFEYTQKPASDKPGSDSVYVMVNEENKISYVIRPKDLYRIPNAYYGKSIYTYDDHEYIDLGLSVNWATCNIGTTKYYPGSYGDFFAWGETEGRSKFINNNYLEPKQKHYYDGKLSVLEPIDDAATKLWGKDWRLPTKEEFQELVDKCKWEWKEQNGHWGYGVTGPNGNMIFLPVGGMKMETRWLNYDEGLYYWTASCLFNDPEREPKAWMFSSVADGPDRQKNRRMQIALTPLSIQTGRSIRPVTTKQYIPIRGVDIDKTELELKVGQESVLTASFIPSDATPRNLYWKSGNSAVAHVVLVQTMLWQAQLGQRVVCCITQIRDGI